MEEIMFLLATVFFFGFASAQTVTRLTYCSIDENQMRMDCKYDLAADSPNAVCKFTEDDKVLDTSNKQEPQHATYKTRAEVSILEGNNCRLRLNQWQVAVGNNSINFTCSIKQTVTASETVTVEKKLMLPCSALSVLLQSCSGLMLTLVTLPMLLERWL